MNGSPRTLFDKIFDAHTVASELDAPAILYVDLHLVHEMTSPQAFRDLRARSLRVRRPNQTLAVVDHSAPTDGLVIRDPIAAHQIKFLEANCQEYGIPLYTLGDSRRGIVHVIGPELGLTQPGMTIVCGDSHTSTHGAFGALAFGIGTSEVGHVLATQCLLQSKPKTLAVRLDGQMPRGVVAKDVILSIIGALGTDGGAGSVIEYLGSTIHSLDMEGRMTICNMSVEAGARAGMIAPDDTTFAYLAGREFAPRGAEWERALAEWKVLPGDQGANFDRTISFASHVMEPMITFGTSPDMGIPITARIPEPSLASAHSQKKALEKALTYMALSPGTSLLGHPINVVFIGSCTNSRIVDLRLAAGLLAGKRIAPNVRALVVPGSQTVKRQAEREGLDRIFLAAGCEWRESGCSMCLGLNGDLVLPGEYCVSTSNRNFEGRQGKGARTFLASPLTAAASALAGAIADPRTFMN